MSRGRGEKAKKMFNAPSWSLAVSHKTFYPLVVCKIVFIKHYNYYYINIFYSDVNTIIDKKKKRCTLLVANS